MRIPFTTRQALEAGVSPASLTRQIKRQQIQRVCQGAYVAGSDPITIEERAAAVTLASRAVAFGTFAATLHELDNISVSQPFACVQTQRKSSLEGVRTRFLPDAHITNINGIPCTSALQTMLDLAEVVSDNLWECALESALRKRLVRLVDLEAELLKRRFGNPRIRRVLERRGRSEPPTESLLETLMVQLIRSSDAIPMPERQVEVTSAGGTVIARVDLVWRDAKIFIELDGSHHANQELHDKTRETAVMAATGWRPVRFTWENVVRTPRVTLDRLERIYQWSVDPKSA